MKISVITACLNAAGTIWGVVESLAGQTHRDYAHIVVDGGSADGTADIVRSYGDKITKFVSGPDGGIYDAMNKGIRLAGGDIVGTLNADDMYADNLVLARVAAAFSDPAVELCYGDLVYVSPGDTGKVMRVWKSAPYEPGLFLRGWVPPHPTVFVRRAVYERYGLFDTAFPLAADFELMLRLLHCRGLKSRYIPHTLVKMRLGGATNKNIANVVRQNIEIYRAGRKNGVTLGPRYFAGKLYDRFKQYRRAGKI